MFWINARECDERGNASEEINSIKAVVDMARMSGEGRMGFGKDKGSEPWRLFI